MIECTNLFVYISTWNGVDDFLSRDGRVPAVIAGIVAVQKYTDPVLVETFISFRESDDDFTKRLLSQEVGW